MTKKKSSKYLIIFVLKTSPTLEEFLQNFPPEALKEASRLEKISPGTISRGFRGFSEEIVPKEQIKPFRRQFSTISRNTTLEVPLEDLQVLKSYFPFSMRSQVEMKGIYDQIAGSLGKSSRSISEKIKLLRSTGIIEENFLIDYSHFRLEQFFFLTRKLLTFEERCTIYKFPLMNRGETLALGLLPSYWVEAWQTTQPKTIQFCRVEEEIFSVNLSGAFESKNPEKLWQKDLPIWDLEEAGEKKKDIHVIHAPKADFRIPKPTWSNAVFLDFLRGNLDILSSPTFTEDKSPSLRYLRRKAQPRLLQRGVITRMSAFKNVGLNTTCTLYAAANAITELEKVSQNITSLPMSHQYIGQNALFAVFSVPSTWEKDLFRRFRELQNMIGDFSEFIISPVFSSTPFPWENTSSYVYSLPQNVRKTRFFTNLFDNKRENWYYPEFLM